jgi:hypothetical protein
VAELFLLPARFLPIAGSTPAPVLAMNAARRAVADIPVFLLAFTAGLYFMTFPSVSSVAVTFI